MNNNNLKIDFSDCIFLVAPGSSLEKDIKLLKEIYDKYRPKIIVADTAFTYLLSKNIIPYMVCNLDHRDEIIQSMLSIYDIKINDTILMGNPSSNKFLWDIWDSNKRLNVGDFPYTLNVLSPMFSYSIIKHTNKYKICLGIDLCWENEDNFYVEKNNQEQGKENINSMGKNIKIKDIYENEVYSGKSFTNVLEWIENISKTNKGKIINSSSGPSILGINTDDILKIKLEKIYNENKIR